MVRFVHVWFQCLHVSRRRFKRVEFWPGAALFLSDSVVSKM